MYTNKLRPNLPRRQAARTDHIILFYPISSVITHCLSQKRQQEKARKGCAFLPQVIHLICKRVVFIFIT